MAFDRYDDWGWAPYVSVAERRRDAMRELEKRRKKGHSVAPVEIEGRKIVTAVWGKAWCANLECYSDYANRLPRGRTYVRNGSVVDLQIAAGAVTALVSGSSLYEIEIDIKPVSKDQWKAICDECGGGIDSLVELLQGRLSNAVMERICRPQQGLFPSPKEIKMDCSCPDGAYMCKHLAAVLYGIGARFDKQPELLFRLRGVDAKDLLAGAGKAISSVTAVSRKERVLEADDLEEMFGLDLGGGSGERASSKGAKPVSEARKKPKAVKRKAAKKDKSS
jgi:uncharacterized Zn finger protein